MMNEWAALNFFLPTLTGTCGNLELEKLCKAWRKSHQFDAKFEAHDIEQIVGQFHFRKGLEWSWGGHLEWRPTRFRGTYMEASQRYLHLGIDYCGPIGAPVHFPFPAKVLHTDIDTDCDIGWGGRTFLNILGTSWVILLCHMCPLQLPKRGTVLRGGELIGYLGAPAVNGGVDPHLHAQAMTVETYNFNKKSKLANLDGYATLAEEPLMRTVYPSAQEVMAQAAALYPVQLKEIQQRAVVGFDKQALRGL